MEYVYGALLLNAAGKTVDEKGISGVLEAAGIRSDPARVKALLASLEGVNIAEVLTKAEAVVAAPAAASGSEKKESKGEKKEEAKKEDKGVSEEEAAEGLSALFG